MVHLYLSISLPYFSQYIIFVFHLAFHFSLPTMPA